jgi:hypothetical protein
MGFDSVAGPSVAMIFVCRYDSFICSPQEESRIRASQESGNGSFRGTDHAEAKGTRGRSATRLRFQHHNGCNDANGDKDSDHHEKDDPVALGLQTRFTGWLGAAVTRDMPSFRDKFVSGPLTVLQAFPLIEMVGHVSDGIAFGAIIPGNADAASTISLAPGSL